MFTNGHKNIKKKFKFYYHLKKNPYTENINLSVTICFDENLKSLHFNGNLLLLP